MPGWLKTLHKPLISLEEYLPISNPRRLLRLVSPVAVYHASTPPVDTAPVENLSGYATGVEGTTSWVLRKRGTWSVGFYCVFGNLNICWRWICPGDPARRKVDATLFPAITGLSAFLCS